MRQNYLMGSVFSTKLKNIFGYKQTRLLMLGLDAAGKTTILYQLRNREIRDVIPFLGFNIEILESENISITAWDVGGAEKPRPEWRKYYENIQGLIFVVDSADRERVECARDELQRTLREDLLKGIPLLVLANKQDLPDAMNTDEVTDRLGVQTIRDRKWLTQGTCAITKAGIYEGLQWIERNLVYN